MAQEILVNEQIEPGLEFIRLFDQRMPVKVAFWMKEPEKERPHLFVASDEITDETRSIAYRLVTELAPRVGGYGIDTFNIKVIRGDDPSVRDALAFQAKEPGARVRALGSYRFGNRWGDDTYVYPRLHAAAVVA